jgi:hypothetical protein
MAQGVTGMRYSVIPRINEALLGAAIIMFSGILVINLGGFLRKRV